MIEAAVALELIQRAFRLAQQSGKTEWWTMTVPVLKNRLLQLTSRKFDEAEFGASNFRELLKEFPDALAIDESATPDVVILKSAAPKGVGDQKEMGGRGGVQIRRDLWRAILDYSSGIVYGWDASDGSAKPCTSNDKPVLPTVSAEIIDDWRAEFAAQHKQLYSAAAKHVEDWLKHRRPTEGLPKPLRPLWNKFLKRKVERRLENWFFENALPAPVLVEKPAPDPDQDELREFILACVKTMPKEELLQLRISPLIALRTSRALKGIDGRK